LTLLFAVVQPNLPAGGEGVEHRAGVGPGAHRQGQLGVLPVRNFLACLVGADEPVDVVEGQVAGGVDLMDGEVEDAAAADRRQLVAVTEQRDPRPALVRDSEQGAGGVLVEHAGLVHHQQIPRPQPRRPGRAGEHSTGRRIDLPDRQPGPGAVAVPTPAVPIGQPGRRPGRRTHLPIGGLGRLQGGGDDDQPPTLLGEQIAGDGQGRGLPRACRALDHHELAVAGQHRGGRGLSRIQPPDPGRGWSSGWCQRCHLRAERCHVLVRERCHLLDPQGGPVVGDVAGVGGGAGGEPAGQVRLDLQHGR